MSDLVWGILLPPAPGPTVCTVKPRSFGMGEGSTVPISLATGVVLLALLMARTRPGVAGVR